MATSSLHSKQTASSQNVLEAFNISDVPILLEGGEGTSYRAGDVVLKPVTDIVETNWRAEVFSKIVPKGFRVAMPVATVDGKWVCDGWQAFTYVEGKEEKGKWTEKIQVARNFLSAIQDVPRPEFIKTASHPWAVADRMVWGELPLEYSDRLAPIMEQLLKLQKPLILQNQLIHGDMSGNILFHPSLSPAVIDFSPFWRPAEYATAIILVDAVVWEGAPSMILDELPDEFNNNQLLIRAALWRIKTTEEYIRQFNRGNIDDVDAYLPLIELLLKRKD